jgi:hypothetical protein
VSRLAEGNVAGDLGVEAIDVQEIPHLKGLPLDVPMPDHTTVVREWPNLAGRFEPTTGGGLVRWNRSLAPPPPSGAQIAWGETDRFVDPAEGLPWFRRFIRTLEQHRGVVIATPTETMRAIVLTPWGVDDTKTLPPGLTPVPEKYAEFPGGVVITVDAGGWDQHRSYAEEIQSWFADSSAASRLEKREDRP